MGEEVRYVQHYNSSQRVLLVGEGDFSFSASLATAFGSAINMVATSLDSAERLLIKHWSSVAHLEELRRLGCLVLHDVDVHDMNRHPILMSMQFDIIIFNFPHAGHYPPLCERNNRLIKVHKKLLMDFFESARELLSVDSEVHVSHRDDYPYNRWKIEKLARRAGLGLKEKVEFQKKDYPGYHNKRGGDIKSNQTFPLGECFTFKFISVEAQGGSARTSETGSSGVTEITYNLERLLF